MGASSAWREPAIWAVLAFVIAVVGTWLARRYAVHSAMLDLPGERRSHDVPMPRGGGIAIVVAVLPVMAWLAWQQAAPAIAVAGVGLLLVAAIGWSDDHRPLPAGIRFAVHAVAATLLAWALLLSGAGIAQAACGFVLALVLVNAWNFMDGIDGLAASQALLAGAGYALFAGSGPVAWIGLSLAAACAGFLPFNLPRARIFLGDVGSGALGYLVAALAALALLGIEWRQAPLLLLPLVAFGADTGLTLARRVLRGERWWQPHVQHGYQQWARRTGHGRVTAWFFAWTLVAVAFMLGTITFPFIVIMCITGISCLAACAAWLYMQRSRESDTGVEG